MTLPYRAYSIRKINDNLSHYTPFGASAQARVGDWDEKIKALTLGRLFSIIQQTIIE